MKVTINTSIGNVTVAPQDGKHICVSGHVTIRQKTKIASIHIYLWSDGKWHFGKEGETTYAHNYHECYISKGDSEVTQAFRTKTIEVLSQTAIEWANTNGDLIAQAQQEYNQRAIAARQKSIANHQQAILDIMKEIEEINNGKILDIGTSVKV